MMDQLVKLLLRWDVKPGSESEYSEFIISEFIPRTKRLGITDVQFWYTSYGEVEQIQVELIAQSKDQMQTILGSQEWGALKSRLVDLVTNYSQKMVRATGGIQL